MTNQNQIVESQELEIEFKQTVVTPELAKHWMSFNIHNRKLSQNQVGFLVNEIRLGNWNLNGETIKFTGPHSNPTRLIDGQHRLQAVIESGITVDMTVAYNVNDPDAMKTIDTGKNRNASDLLSLEGVANSNYISSIIKNYLYLKRSHRSGLKVAQRKAGKFRLDRVSNTEVIECYQSLEGVEETYKMSHLLYTKHRQVLSRTSLGAVYLFAREENEAITEAFFAELHKDNLSPNSPAFACIDYHLTKKLKNETVRGAKSTACLIYCLNKYYQGEQVKRIRESSLNNIKLKIKNAT